MKTILITGAAGFVGSHFVDYCLTNTDWNVVALVRMSRAGDLNRLTSNESNPRLRIVRHDLLDSMDSIHGHIGQVNYIVHMAADSHVDDSLVRRKPVFMNNVESTVNILEYAVNYQEKLEKFIYYSTDEVYGDGYGDINFSELDRISPQNPYSAGKAAGEMACLAWARCTGLPLTITRTMNMFGEMQNPEKMIPKTIGRLLRGLPAIVHKHGNEYGSRHWLYVKNSCDSLLYILNNKLENQILNVEGVVELDNLEIATKIADIMSIKLKYEAVDALSIRPGYDRKYSIDGTKLRELGWIPPFNFGDSLNKTVKWSVENPDWVI